MLSNIPIIYNNVEKYAMSCCVLLADLAKARYEVHAYKINNFNSCPKKEHKNNEHNPWCLHGLGQEVWFESKNGPGEEEEDHFSVRPKYLGRYSGLRNLGATCYVNSLTQILYHNKIFRNKLYQYRPSHDETGAVIRTLQKVLVDLEYSLHGVIDTTALVTSLQLPTTEQQDVVEFGELLFGLLNNSIPSLQDTCKGKGSYITRCLTCGNVTTRSSDFTDLKLQVQPRNRTLAERIQQLSTVEILEGDNSYHCAQCNMLRRVERCFVVNQYPKTLQLQLLRFNYNTSTMQRTKDTSFVKFNDILTLFNLAGDSGHTSKTYKLSGIIIHVGETTQSGHYIAIIKRGDKWVTFNDDVVLELDKLDLKQYDLSSTRRPGCASGEHCSQSVYMLVYEDGSEEFVSLPIVSPVVLPQSSGSSTEESRITDFFSRTTPASSENTSPNQISTRSTNHAEPGGESSVVVGEKEGEVPPPSDILSATLAENLEFEQLRELLMEQRKDVRSNKEVRVVAMRDACCRMSPENEASFVPLPSDMLKTWIETGIPQKLNPEDNLAQNTTTSTSPSSDEVQLLGETTESCLTKLLCVHNKLPYHKLRQLKYVERDIISQIVDDGTKVLGSEVKFKSENCRGDNAVKTEGCDENNQQNCQVKIEDEVAEGTKTVIAEGVPPEYDLKDAKKVEIQSKSLSLENLMLCEECVASDLRQHLYDLTLEDDFKRIGIVQNKDPEIGWWVVKDDFRNFKKIVRQGGNFNKEINCRHSSLDPDPKRRKLVSFDVKTIVKKYFPEFPAPSYLEEPCQVCTDECDQEKLYISTILLHRRDLQRLLTDGAFPYIPSLTPYVIPSSFIKYDLRPFYRKKIQDRIFLDNTVLICKHSLLASDALEHAAFVKESEWELLNDKFGPTTTIRCDSADGAILYTPAVCRECVMLHDVFTDQVVYLREDKTAGKRGRRGDKVLHLSSHDTVRDVKIQICEKMAIAPSEQTLRTQNGKILDTGTMRELGIIPGSIIYLEYNHALLQEAEVFTSSTEQGFKGTVLSGL